MDLVNARVSGDSVGIESRRQQVNHLGRYSILAPENFVKLDWAPGLSGTLISNFPNLGEEFRGALIQWRSVG